MSEQPQPTQPDPHAARRFRIRAPLGMTLTDAHGREHDHQAGAELAFATFHTTPRHLATLVRVGDLEEITDGVPTR